MRKAVRRWVGKKGGNDEANGRYFPSARSSKLELGTEERRLLYGRVIHFPCAARIIISELSTNVDIF